MTVTQKNAALVRGLIEKAEQQTEALQILNGWHGQGTISVRNENRCDIVSLDVNTDILKTALGTQLERTQSALAALGIEFKAVS